MHAPFNRGLTLRNHVGDEFVLFSLITAWFLPCMDELITNFWDTVELVFRPEQKVFSLFFRRTRAFQGMGMEDKVGSFLCLKIHTLDEVSGEIASFFTEVSIEFLGAL